MSDYDFDEDDQQLVYYFGPTEPENEGERFLWVSIGGVALLGLLAVLIGVAIAVGP